MSMRTAPRAREMRARPHKMKPAAVHHNGAVVALSDAIQCPAEQVRTPDPSEWGGWSCSLLPGHEGDHVAYCFDEKTGLPEAMPVATWGDEP